MNRRELVIGVLLASVLGLTGCESGSEKREQEMLAHMYEKYGVEFQVDDFAETVYAHSYDSWNCSLKGNTDPEQEGSICVIKWRDESKGGYEDTYFPILIKEEIESRVHQSLEAYEEEYKMYVYSDDSDFVDNKFVDESQLEEYLKEEGNEHAVYTVKVMVLDKGSEEENEKNVQIILERLREANIGNPYMNIFCMEKGIYEEQTRSSAKELLKKMDGKIMYQYRYGGELNADTN